MVDKGCHFRTVSENTTIIQMKALVHHKHFLLLIKLNVLTLIDPKSDELFKKTVNAIISCYQSR